MSDQLFRTGGGSLMKLFPLLGIGIGLSISSLVTANPLPFNQMIIFGDSLSDNGNDLIGSGFTIPIPPEYTLGRFTNGPDVTPTTKFVGVWNEQLAVALGLPVAQPFLAGGTNYAFGGADTSFGYDVFGVPGLGVQVSIFLSLNPIAPSNALYVVEGGGNDILNAAEAPGATAANVAAAEQLAIQNLQLEITALALHGAKDFLWMDFGPLQLAPETQSNPLIAAIGSASLQFQSDWLAAQVALESSLGIKIAGVDLYDSYLLWRSNPAAYGLTDINDSAYFTGATNPDTYLTWDLLHPTTKGHNLIAHVAGESIQSTFGAPAAVPEPSSGWLFGLVAVPFTFLRIWKRSRAKSNA